MRNISIWLIAGATIGLAVRASADDGAPSARLVWDAPDSCLSAADIAQASSERLGRPAFVGEGSELDVEVRIAPNAEGRYEARVSMSVAQSHALVGTRTLVSETDDCHALDDPLAVVLAIMLDVRRDEIEEHTDPEVMPAPRGPDPWGMRGGLRGGLVLGLLPTPAFEGTAFLGGFLRGTFDLDLELAFDVGDRTAVAGGEIEIRAAAARIVGSVMLIPGPIELSVRVGVGAGPMWGTGSGYDGSGSTQVLTFVEARAGLRLAIQLVGPLWVDVHADVGVVPLRPLFFLLGADGSRLPLFEPSIVTGAFGAGLTLRTE